ncbi:hypothetical protein [Enterobacter sp.]|uniref:hypothetical protein n=1 Tax=Enterobacter sp. TaxID=42895 RepID=UPI00296F8F5F|nr:hypothetical protein [Enterobacter sp.]
MIILTIAGQKHSLSPEDAHLLRLALASVTEGKSTERGYRVRSSAFSVERAVPQTGPDKHSSGQAAPGTLTDC